MTHITIEKEKLEKVLEALKTWVKNFPSVIDDLDKQAVADLEQALAAQPVPAREDWGPGPHEVHSLPAPVQEPVAAKDWEGAEYWMPLAWELCADECGEEACTELVWEGGPIPEPWGERWLKYEDEAKRLIALVQKHTIPPAAQPAPVQEPVSQDPITQLQVAQIIAMRDSTPPAAQPAPVPVSWMEMVAVNLLREGVNKHKARELAEHFYGLSQPTVQEPDLSSLKPATQEAIKGWLADGTFVERAIGAMEAQERENMRLEKLVAALPAVPDAITDNSESPEYRAGWNECREVMAGMLRGKP
jgi:hypothetical protein